MSHGKRIVVAGINTEVGKTVIATILTEALSGYYWKPVQCGVPCDRDWVNERLSLENRCYPENFCFDTPCSPHLAARIEGIRMEARSLMPPTCSSHLIIEGTGGFLSPLNEIESWADAAILWDAQWVLVHRHYLGSLNHFFLTIEAMKHRKLPLVGVVFNGNGETDTEEMLLKKTGTRCLGRLLWQQQLTPTVIQKIAKEWRAAIHEAL
jgi:dethiobiotin synthetase